MKRNLVIFFIICIILNLSFANAVDQNGGYVGTPPGFYDDINPETLDNEEESSYGNDAEEQNSAEQPTNSEKENILYSEPIQPTKNYPEIYNKLEPTSYSYLHGIDPDEYYDVKDATWSIYPLLRLNSAIYFKNIIIEPGYYLLTPREHNGKWYILFKQNGKVVHIIPVYERGYTPKNFYDEHIPKPKLTKSQKIHMIILDTVGKTKSSKRKEPVKSFLEVNDLDNYFISIVIYYGGHKYSTLFRTIRL